MRAAIVLGCIWSFLNTGWCLMVRGPPAALWFPITDTVVLSQLLSPCFQNFVSPGNRETTALCGSLSCNRQPYFSHGGWQALQWEGDWVEITWEAPWIYFVNCKTRDAEYSLGKPEFGNSGGWREQTMSCTELIQPGTEAEPTSRISGGSQDARRTFPKGLKFW